MSNQAFLDEDTRNNLLLLENKGGLTNEKVTDIITEGTGELDTGVTIEVYTQEDFKIGNESGLNVSAVHIQDTNENTNEVYYFFRGTEPSNFNDVWTDAAGIAAGSNTEQLEDSIEFKENVNRVIESETPEVIPKNYADAYSLGVNNASGLMLISKDFEDMRGFNGAPINAYHLAEADSSFEQYLNGEGYPNIRKIPQELMSKYIYDYYGEEVHKIVNYRQKGEPLYAQSFPGKMYLGKVVTFGEDSGVDDFVDVGSYPYEPGVMNLPLLYDEISYNGRIERWLNDLGGIDERNGGIKGVEELGQSPFKLFVEASNTQTGKEIIFSPFRTFRDVIFSPGVWKQTSSIKDAWGQMDLHSLEIVLSSYDKEKSKARVRYVRLDPVSNKQITLEPETLYQFLNRCELGLTEKKEVLNNLKNYESNIMTELYTKEQSEIIKKIDAKSASPQAFLIETNNQYGFWGKLGKDREARSVTFDEDFSPLDGRIKTPIIELISLFEEEISEMENFLENYKETYIKMFEKDEELSKYINVIKS
ncbi:DUF6792 domain-containing protein [Rossellomorea marisflavi]|uniref:DUF6792 domain-containing protein n=1 Tax=Rossellomorea marisflavi TaxID=189381 RepID=UPI001EE1B070|nr:DUF6792 domain-containing protein [Rossellomorea marisflavi]UKS65220.1 hypothetical protein K6T23_21295 [Rossellomorea marisflavi]